MDENLQLVLEAWKKTIEVQQHFNDLELRIRNLAITILAAIFGLTGVAISNHVFIILFNWTIPLASWLLLVGLVSWLAFYFMDRCWYHSLLGGAVKHATTIENRIKQSLPDITLTTDISQASPMVLSLPRRCPYRLNRPHRSHCLFCPYCPPRQIKIHSTQKMDIFYITIAFAIFIFIIIISIAV